ncbi:unnamed protein product [Staurois parvus]|uniref:PiggyBac transposable element-derived protein domain-containing protein n=1 Tax=Staurois parvus TaxID=386267 RepID=A0ABN9F182_9NEOB|nr:unnamed protein product [Staurois parvus]
MVSKFKVFWGLTLNMGITKTNELRLHWSADPIHHMTMFSAAMARHRYETILRFMHFNDNTLCHPLGDPEFDRLHKIRPLVNHFNQKCADVYTPQQNICMDESLINFSGCLAFKQFIPSKRSMQDMGSRCIRPVRGQQAIHISFGFMREMIVMWSPLDAQST